MASANRLTITDCAFWLFVAAVALLPVGLGGNRPLPLGLAQAALALSCLGLILGRKEWPPPYLFTRLRWALGLFAIVVFWAWVQTQYFVPASWMHPLWKESAGVLKIPLRGAISISPEDSFYGLDRLVTYIAVGLLGFVLGQDPSRARRLAQALWLAGATICAYGLIVYVFGAHKILWFDKWAYEDDLTATFVNRNHFAVYADLVLTSGVALIIQSFREDVQTRRQSARAAALRAWLLNEGAPKVYLLIFVFLCIVLSHSRAGLVLAVVGPGSYVFFYQIYLKAWRRAIAAALSAFFVLALAVLAAWHYSDRFALLFNDYSSFDRLTVYRLTLDALRDNLWLGYGLDGFQAVFRLYQRGMIMEFARAHSDYLESLLDLGLPAGFLLWCAIGLLVSGLVRGVTHRRRHGMFPALGLAASVIVLSHAAVDFSMQIPGVVFPWAALVGSGLAQSWRRSEKQPARQIIE